MIKILHLITSFGLGGTETNLLRLACHMDRSRFDNTIVTMVDVPGAERGALQLPLEQAGVPFHSLAMRRGTPDPVSVARLVRIILRVRPHILQTWLYHADLLGLLVGRLTRVPVIAWNLRCSFMDMSEYSPVSNYVRRALVALSRFPNVVLTNSQSGLRFHEGLGYKPRKWMWMPNSLDLNFGSLPTREGTCAANSDWHRTHCWLAWLRALIQSRITRTSYRPRNCWQPRIAGFTLSWSGEKSVRTMMISFG